VIMKCPVCEKVANYIKIKESDNIIVDCDRCKKFITVDPCKIPVSDRIDYKLKELNKQNYMLSGILREIKEFGGNNGNFPEVYSPTIKDFFNSHKIPETVSEKIDKLLLYLEKRTSFLGSDVSISFEKDYPVVYASRADEIIYLLNLLKDLQYVKLGPEVNLGLIKGCSMQCCIDIAGWKRLEEIRKINPDSKICFTAMSFDKNERYIFDEGIFLGAKDAGYEAKRVDNDEYNNQITDQMIILIRQSKFIIADFTNSNKKGGIYYEAGFAKGYRIACDFHM